MVQLRLRAGNVKKATMRICSNPNLQTYVHNSQAPRWEQQRLPLHRNVYTVGWWRNWTCPYFEFVLDWNSEPCTNFYGACAMASWSWPAMFSFLCVALAVQLSALRTFATNESVNSENDHQLAWLASVMLLCLLYETCRRAES